MRLAQAKSYAKISAFVLTTALSGALFPAAAQENGPQASGAQSAEIGEIIVTARKRAERLRDVPESVSALSSEDLNVRGIATVADLGRQSPGLQLNRRQDNTPNVTMRGVGSFGNVQGVGFFLDDVQNFTDQTMRLEDVGQIEILKGPQGTLYGGSAVGGAIKYNSVKPTFDTYVRATAEFGEKQYQNLYAALNTPVADTLALRVSGYLTHDDGFEYPHTGVQGIWRACTGPV